MVDVFDRFWHNRRKKIFRRIFSPHKNDEHLRGNRLHSFVYFMYHFSFAVEMSSIFCGLFMHEMETNINITNPH